MRHTVTLNDLVEIYVRSDLCREPGIEAVMDLGQGLDEVKSLFRQEGREADT